MALLTFLILLSASLINKIESSTTSSETQSSSSKKTTLTPPVRVKNLDHWDDATISTYFHLDPKTLNEIKEEELSTGLKNGIPDAVVMFYAQWSDNSHSLAPLYDKIATLLNAGYADSNRIMALYDCERNTLSKQICQAVSVTSYPSLMYVSQHSVFHDTDWLTSSLFGLKRSCGPMGCTKQKHSVKFQGDWRYGEEIYDWIVVMGGLSKWSKWSRSWKQSWKHHSKDGSKKTLSAQPLIVGVPNTSTTTMKSTSDTTASNNEDNGEQLAQLQSKLQEVEKKSKSYQDATKHAGLLIDSILFFGQGNTDNNNNNTSSETDDATTVTTLDPFTVIHERNLWSKFHVKLPKEDSIILSCVMDLSVDYCTRNIINNKKRDLMTKNNNTTTTKLSETGKEDTMDDEPYCNIIDDCLQNNFQKPKECQPISCPFTNPLACTYVNSCLNIHVQKEYAIALGL